MKNRLVTSLAVASLTLFGLTAAPQVAVADDGEVACVVGASTIAECFPDKALAQAIAHKFGPGSGAGDTADVLSHQDVSDTEHLYLQQMGVRSLEGIEVFSNLTELYFQGNQISDLTPLANLTELDMLIFGDNLVSDLTPIAGLTKLLDLEFAHNQVSDLTPVEHFPKLRSLLAEGNAVSDLSPLKDLNNLENLLLGDNRVTDLTPLINLSNLNALFFDQNQVEDLTPLAKLSSLVGLSFVGNRVSDVSVLEGLTDLVHLGFAENRVSDVSVLAKLTRLANFEGMVDVDSLAFEGPHSQQVALDTLVLAGGETVRVATAIDQAGAFVEPATIAPQGGLYDPSTGTVSWADVAQDGEYALTFHTEVPIGPELKLFSGSITQPVTIAAVVPANPVDGGASDQPAAAPAVAPQATAAGPGALAKTGAPAEGFWIIGVLLLVAAAGVGVIGYRRRAR